ncbi:glycerate kinase family protein [Actinomarinicola tropica]|uniref:Glycerate kinase n=1 Tax=Actinomarinicola tropica TaxID=2789776 RepID=A0A5Q2RKV5_9ACTN|nr:glycerate kinase [Actinomarinicola tropica]QGG96463.1 glycerate kinase [Actinomarinicola tropica]
MRVVAAPDKFKGTASAAEVARAVADGARAAGWRCTEVPLADGGEGTLEVLGGANRTTLVSGPLGDPVRAGWRLVRGRAVIEMAAASGLDLVGGPDGNDPVTASTTGTGELIAAALDAGASHILVTLGGSATTDGGLGALRALSPFARMRGVELVVACDVTTRFLDAAEVFAPQKGASPAQVELLRRRLERLAQVYLDEHGVDVTVLDGGGAAGGLAGGLAAIGAQLTSGFDAVADHVGLDELIEDADLVVTGEGFVDAQSFDGKVVGGVAEMSASLGVPVLAVAGEVYDGVEDRLSTVSLVERCGRERALAEPLACITELVAAHLAQAAGR